MSKNILETLFESRSKVKILKFLFRNVDASFTLKEITNRVQEPSSVVRGDLKKLLDIGLLKVKK